MRKAVKMRKWENGGKNGYGDDGRDDQASFLLFRYLLFDNASFSMVVYGRVVLVIPKQSFMAQLFVTQITVVISSHHFCVEHHGMMVKLTRHPDRGFQKADTRQCSEYPTLGQLSRIPNITQRCKWGTPGVNCQSPRKKIRTLNSILIEHPNKKYQGLRG